MSEQRKAAGSGQDFAMDDLIRLLGSLTKAMIWSWDVRTNQVTGFNLFGYASTTGAQVNPAAICAQDNLAAIVTGLQVTTVSQALSVIYGGTSAVIWSGGSANPKFLR